MMNGVNGFEPLPDYGPQSRANRSDLPFIPPPDYAKTMKYMKNKDMNGHPTAVPQPPPRQRPKLNGLANGDRASPEPVELPREQKSDPKERILKMLQKQGVPVFPGLNSKQEASIEKPEPPIAPPQNPTSNLGPTKAYLKHLENHRNFDTMQSFRGMDNCPICKEMQEEIEQIELLSQGRTRKDHRNGHSHDSLITSGKAFQPLDALVEDEMEPEEDANEIIMPPAFNAPSSTRDYFSQQPSTSSRNEKPVGANYVNGSGPDLALTARPLSDWDAESANQLSVKFSETLKVLEMGVNWWRCENSSGEVGWVPTKQLYLMPTGYY